MPLVKSAALSSGGGEGLAGARACPKRSVVGPSGELKGVCPARNAGKEMALSEASEILRLDLGDGSLVDVSAGNSSSCDEVLEPLGAEGVAIVVIGMHLCHLSRGCSDSFYTGAPVRQQGFAYK